MGKLFTAFAQTSEQLWMDHEETYPTPQSETHEWSIQNLSVFFIPQPNVMTAALWFVT